jgi:hypothetical protein
MLRARAGRCSRPGIHQRRGPSPQKAVGRNPTLDVHQPGRLGVGIQLGSTGLRMR